MRKRNKCNKTNTLCAFPPKDDQISARITRDPGFIVKPKGIRLQLKSIGMRETVFITLTFYILSNSSLTLAVTVAGENDR